MIEKIRDLSKTLEEEIKYHENIISHKKSLEATLWGLEEQSKMPENSSKNDQTELNEHMNDCRKKIINCKKILNEHLKKVINIISSSVAETTDCSGCPK